MKKIGKKLSLCLLLACIGLCSFAYFQINQLQQQLEQSLVQAGIKSGNLEFSLRPAPVFKINALSYQWAEHSQVTTDSITLSFHPLSLFNGVFRIDEIRFANVNLWIDSSTPNWQQIDVQLKPDFLTLTDLPLIQQNWEKWLEQSPDKGRFQLAIQGKYQQNGFTLRSASMLSPQKILFENSQIDFQLAKNPWRSKNEFHINIAQMDTNIFPLQSKLIQAKQVQVNQQNLGDLQLQLNLLQQNAQLNLALSKDCQCTLQIKGQRTEQDIAYQIEAQNYPIQRLFGALNLHQIINLNANFNGSFLQQNQNISQGYLQLEGRNGSLQGLNLLDLVRQYLPINYDEEKELNQQFDFLRLQAHWNNSEIKVEDVQLNAKNIQVTGSGLAETQSMYCDFKVKIGLTNDKYSQFNLPIRFFDRCSSPKYQIEIDRDFRHSLKNLLKQTFKND